MNEYERLIETLSRKWCNFDGNIPSLYGTDFVCMVNDKEFLFSDGDAYTYDKILKKINKICEEEERELEREEAYYEMQMALEASEGYERYEI